MKMKAITSVHPKTYHPIKFVFDFPDDFVLVTDSREQDHLFQYPPKGLGITRDTLSVGDYSIRGFEDAITVERKTIPELLNCLGNDKERFKRELEKMAGYEWKAVVVEGSESEVLQYHPNSLLHPNAIRQSIVSINIRYKIQFTINRTGKVWNGGCWIISLSSCG